MRRAAADGGVGTQPRFEFDRSAQFLHRAEAIIPGGAHTYARGADQYPESMAPFLVSGSGCRVIDLDNNQLVEYGIGLRAVVLGHACEPVDAAVRQAMSGGINFARPHVAEAEVAELLASLIPCAEMVKFAVSGSDANNAAIRLARAHTGRDLIARCSDQPFFSTEDWFMGTTPMNAGIPQSTQDMVFGFPYNDLPALRSLFESRPGEFAAIIMEAETITPPQSGYFDGVRALCDQHGVVFILDEVITGFRWSVNGAQSVHGIRPDLATFAKAMGNGYPVAALVGKRELMRLGGFVTDADRVFLLSQTYAGSTLSLAAVKATVRHAVDSKTPQALQQIGSSLRSAINEVVAEAGLDAYVRVLGQPQCMVFATRNADGEPSQEFRTLVLRCLLENGIIAPNLVVSAAHDDAAINQTAEAFRSAMPRYAAALEHGVERQLVGRPVRPAFRRRG